MTPLNNRYYTRLHQLCDCPECSETREENHISKQLRKLPKMKAGAGFDQKMAALFAIELDEEVSRKSRSLLRKSNKISIPDLITDLSKEFN